MNSIDSGWRIELFGRLRVIHGQRVLTHFRTRKTAVLLGYLAYHAGRPHPREELMELLWPEHRVDAARHSLCSALSWLRRQLASLLDGTGKARSRQLPIARSFYFAARVPCS